MDEEGSAGAGTKGTSVIWFGKIEEYDGVCTLPRNNSHLDPELQLSSRSSVELLESSGLSGIKNNITTGAIGVSFKDYLFILGNSEKGAKL